MKEDRKVSEREKTSVTDGMGGDGMRFVCLGRNLKGREGYRELERDEIVRRVGSSKSTKRRREVNLTEKERPLVYTRSPLVKSRPCDVC